jgi:Phosphotransferase enzyme family
MSSSPEHVDLDSVVDYLLSVDLLDVDELIDGELTVDPVPRRHQNYRVTRSDGAGFFLKQPDPTVRSGAATLRTEGDFYRRAESGSSALPALPRLVHWDRTRPLLVVDLLGDHVTLSERVRARVPPEFPIGVWRAVGRSLGQAHTVLGRAWGRPALRGDVPWVTSTPLPDLRALSEMSQAGAAVLEIVQGSDPIRAGLRAVADSWRPLQTIHGDVRASNILVSADPTRRPADVRFVDWELVCAGDPLWDLAGVLDALLLDQDGPLTGVDGDDGEVGDDRPPVEVVPWPVFQSASRAAWEGYRSAAPPYPTGPMRHRTMLYAAARLVEGTIEATARADEITAELVSTLQVAENVFTDPDLAATDLFALAD